MPATATPMPSRARRSRAAKSPEPPSGRSSPPARAGGRSLAPPSVVLGSSIATVGVKLAILPLMYRHDRRICLHHIVARGARPAVLVRAVVDHRHVAAKIVVRRWRGRRPFQRRGFPGIVAGLLA